MALCKRLQITSPDHEQPIVLKDKNSSAKVFLPLTFVSLSPRLLKTL